MHEGQSVVPGKEQVQKIAEKTVERVLVGTVVSDKMDKTGTALVERQVKHALYGKYVKKSTKIQFHDEENKVKFGDKVEIKACRPISKRKSWTLAKVVESAKSSI